MHTRNRRITQLDETASSGPNWQAARLEGKLTHTKQHKMQCRLWETAVHIEQERMSQQNHDCAHADVGWMQYLLWRQRL